MTLKNLAKVYSAELEGIDAKLIEVEVDMNVGLHAFNIVGLADRSLNEARERVNSALKNSGVKPPNRENRKITINLAPANIRKNGSHYDLAIALGYLLATKQVTPFDSRKKIFIGELALDGRLRPVNGALNIAQMAHASGFTHLFLPYENATEAAAITNLIVIPLKTLDEAIAYLEGRISIDRVKQTSHDESDRDAYHADAADLSDIIGQANAKRALAIAASGSHNLLFIGPPGVGKSMLAGAVTRILPKPTREEAIEITKIWSASGLSPGKLIFNRPFRAPHQTTSLIALIGGGNTPRPGEISLAHRGVLFLDELPEFPRATLELLRAPMESGIIRIARARGSILFPAKFFLIAAMNPCPCGYYGDPEHECRCSPYEIVKYQKKISGPLLDRIDLQVRVGRVKIADIQNDQSTISERANISQTIKAQVDRARKIQLDRFAGTSIFVNAEMSSREARRFADFDQHAEAFLKTLGKSRLSPRGYYRVLKVARTIADMENVDHVSAEHLAEAFSYRLKEDP